MGDAHTASLQSRLARHAAFWSGAPVASPLIGGIAKSYTYSILSQIFPDGGMIEPEHLRTHLSLLLDFAGEVCQGDRLAEGDLFAPASVIYGLPWMEAYLGLPIQVQGELFWPLESWPAERPLAELHLTRRPDWLDALVGYLAAIAGRFGQMFPVAPPFLRGPIDVLAGMIGTQRACLSLYDQPVEMERLIQECADAWLELSRTVRRAIPPFAGGSVNNARWVWSPGPCAYTSEDSTTFLSAAMYRRFLLPADQRISAAFPYGFMHRHSVSCQSILDLLALNPGWAVEITVDPMGPALSELLPQVGALQAAGRGVILYGLRTADDLSLLADAVSPRRLCLIVEADSPESFRDLADVGAQLAWRP